MSIVVICSNFYPDGKGNKGLTMVIPEKRTIYFQMNVNSLVIVRITKLMHTIAKHIITDLTLILEPRYLSLKLTKCQRIQKKGPFIFKQL